MHSLPACFRFFQWRLGRSLAWGAGLCLLLSASLSLATPGWLPVASMQNARSEHTATLLPNGRVLVVGGSYKSPASTELYDPASNTWAAAGTLATGRTSHTATLLPNGWVLVAGGRGDNGALASAELYDPARNTWTSAGSFSSPRYGHTATLLPNGLVLIAGGSSGDPYDSGNNALGSAELYDPALNQWRPAGVLSSPRSEHTATLLPNGKVLIAGGSGSGGSLASAESYDPASNAWSAAGALSTKRRAHTATLLPNGKVLLTGGGDGNNEFGRNSLASTELYDPASNAWTAGGRLDTAREKHTATLLNNGQVQVVGGKAGRYGDALSAVEWYDPERNVWTRVGALNTASWSHTATLLPNGKVLVLGGAALTEKLILAFVRNYATAELFDPAGNHSPVAAGDLATPRSGHTATPLPDGRVLVAGGSKRGEEVAGAELYDPASNTWAAAGTLLTARSWHTATLLKSGKVLVVGGSDKSPASTELYDPASNAWSEAPPLSQGRKGHAATLLPDGRVLVTGGSSSYSFTAELYDPAANAWEGFGEQTRYFSHVATLLSSGKVFVFGYNSNGSNGANLFDPATKAWTPIHTDVKHFFAQTATLLLSGKVLITDGGQRASLLYDPLADTWTTTGDRLVAEQSVFHTATLLPDGQVLVAGGGDGVWNPVLAGAQLYDPAKNAWAPAGTLISARSRHSATLLPSGEVLFVGGSGETGVLATAELFDASATATAVEYLHRGHGHYFITASPEEAAAIDGGAAGAGWERTGGSFKVHNRPASGSVPVCRFYGSVAPGPNSHFFTADAGECAALKALQGSTPASQARWNYEGTAYYVAVPQGGACPNGGAPVHRYYNNGHARGVDANHRLTANGGVRGTMEAAGWIYEGVMMCAAR